MKITHKHLLAAKAASTPNMEFNSIGLLNSTIPNTLSFLSKSKYLSELTANDNVTTVFTTRDLAPEVRKLNKIVILTKDPIFSFFTTHNYFAKKKRQLEQQPTQISKSAQIDKTAVISNHGVTIGKNVVIEPLVSIMSDTVVEDNSIIRAGSVIGVEGFEHKLTTFGIVSVVHDGMVILRNGVEIGANNTISKGMMGRDTVVGMDTKTDNLVHIAHGVQIGQRCLITAGVTIAGSSSIGDKIWIGPGAIISNGIKIDNNARISLGSVVTKDVQAGVTVTGNFAIDHSRFISNLKESLK